MGHERVQKEEDMTWQDRVAGILNSSEEGFDRLKNALGQRLGRDHKLVIAPYLGYGSATKVRVYGRVLANAGDLSGAVEDSLWENLWAMYQRAESDEIPYPEVEVQMSGVSVHLIGNEEGFFGGELLLPDEEPGDEGVFRPARYIVRLGEEQIETFEDVLLPGTGAQFGVISDLDDTVLQSFANEPLRMLSEMLTKNARTRRPFAGVAAFYNALTEEGNPLFYVSSSPWNMYDLLVDFLAVQGLPEGPLFLRDWGVTADEFLPTDHRGHKLERLRELLDFYGELEFVLIGDNGQQDPEIYYELVAQYPDRIRAVLIRMVDEDSERIAEVEHIGLEIKKAGSRFAASRNTLGLAQAALEMSLIGDKVLAVVEEAQQEGE